MTGHSLRFWDASGGDIFIRKIWVVIGALLACLIASSSFASSINSTDGTNCELVFASRVCLCGQWARADVTREDLSEGTIFEHDKSGTVLGFFPFTFEFDDLRALQDAQRSVFETIEGEGEQRFVEQRQIVVSGELASALRYNTLNGEFNVGVIDVVFLRPEFGYRIVLTYSDDDHASMILTNFYDTVLPSIEKVSSK